MAKVDVVIPYYRQLSGLKRLVKTLLNNRAHINRVIVVNDEPWDPKEIATVMYGTEGLSPVSLLDHEHNGFGITRSMNQGMAASTTDYVLIVPADCLLPTGFIERKLAATTHGAALISGPCHHVEPDSNPDDPKYIRQDGFMHLRELGRGQNAPWLYLRGVNKLVHRQSWKDIGGMDERFDECNYEDYEFVMRCLTNYGLSSVLWEETPVLHQGDPRGGQEPKDPYPLKSAALLAQQLITLRNGNVMLLTDHTNEWSPEFACIGEKHGVATDVALPCQYPDWLQSCEVELLRCNAFHQISYPEHWFQAFAKPAPHYSPSALELSPVHKKDLALFDRYGYTIVGQDSVDRSVRAVRKDLL